MRGFDARHLRLAGGFHSATLATFDRSLRFRSTQVLPRSIRRCVEPPAAPPVGDTFLSVEESA